mmetsp:Transcript_605/g.1348  ORF Transcript_605/g.1348 Transcript_605/m.1348 type:complete len:441 (-) Transcript_605:407-1729(-)
MELGLVAGSPCLRPECGELCHHSLRRLSLPLARCSGSPPPPRVHVLSILLCAPLAPPSRGRSHGIPPLVLHAVVGGCRQPALRRLLVLVAAQRRQPARLVQLQHTPHSLFAQPGLSLAPGQQELDVGGDGEVQHRRGAVPLPQPEGLQRSLRGGGVGQHQPQPRHLLLGHPEQPGQRRGLLRARRDEDHELGALVVEQRPGPGKVEAAGVAVDGASRQLQLPQPAPHAPRKVHPEHVEARQLHVLGAPFRSLQRQRQPVDGRRRGAVVAEAPVQRPRTLLVVEPQLLDDGGVDGVAVGRHRLLHPPVDEEGGAAVGGAQLQARGLWLQRHAADDPVLQVAAEEQVAVLEGVRQRGLVRDHRNIPVAVWRGLVEDERRRPRLGQVGDGGYFRKPHGRLQRCHSFVLVVMESDILVNGTMLNPPFPSFHPFCPDVPKIGLID